MARRFLRLGGIVPQSSGVPDGPCPAALCRGKPKSLALELLHAADLESSVLKGLSAAPGRTESFKAVPVGAMEGFGWGLFVCFYTAG